MVRTQEPTLVNRSVVFTKPGQPLEIWEAEVAGPPRGGLLAKVVMAGVCGSDVHRLAGHQVDPGHPVTFGHENIGVIEELGEDCATDWAGAPVSVGDLVYWQPAGACNRCRQCLAGNSAMCEGVPPGRKIQAGLPSPAGFQRYATLSSRIAFFRVPEETTPESVLAFGCAMPTALGAFARLGTIEPWHTVLVQGAGPVGLAATMLAGLSPTARVITVGAPAHRLGIARRLGATDVIALESADAAGRQDQVMSLTGGRGADVVVEATGQLGAFREGLEMLAVEGRYLVVGLFSGGGEVPFDPVRLNNRSQRVIGSLSSEPNTRFSTVQLARRLGDKHGLSDLITARFGLGEVERAVDAVRAGEGVKTVVEPQR